MGWAIFQVIADFVGLEDKIASMGNTNFNSLQFPSDKALVGQTLQLLATAINGMYTQYQNYIENQLPNPTQAQSNANNFQNEIQSLLSKNRVER